MHAVEVIVPADIRRIFGEVFDAAYHRSNTLGSGEACKLWADRLGSYTRDELRGTARALTDGGEHGRRTLPSLGEVAECARALYGAGGRSGAGRLKFDPFAGFREKWGWEALPALADFDAAAVLAEHYTGLRQRLADDAQLRGMYQARYAARTKAVTVRLRFHCPGIEAEAAAEVSVYHGGATDAPGCAQCLGRRFCPRQGQVTCREPVYDVERAGGVTRLGGALKNNHHLRSV